MSGVAEVDDDNRWVVYLKSESGDEAENGNKDDHGLEVLNVGARVEGEDTLNIEEIEEIKEENIEEDEEIVEEDEEEQAESEGSDGEEIESSEPAATSGTMKPARNASTNPLPAKSKEKYESIYNNFLAWKNTKGLKPLSQETLMEYFLELAKEKKPSTLWSHYSMLKSTIYNHHKLDISTFRKLLQFLRKKSVGYKSKKTKTLTSCEIEKFLKEAPDCEYLATKVVLILGIIGACRRDEFCNITTDDIEDTGSMIIIKIASSDGQNPRLFTVTGKFYDIFKKYASLRPKNVPTNRFFLNYHRGKCTQQVIGINKFGSMPKQIARFLNLPDSESYTAHSFRRTSAKLLADSGATATQLKHHCGCKFNKMAERCIEETVQTKRKLSEHAAESVSLDPSSPKELHEQSDAETPPPKRQKDETEAQVESLITNSEETTIKIQHVGRAVEIVTPVMQSNPQSNSNARSLKLTGQSRIHPQVKNIAPAPSPQQQGQPKTLVLKTIPLKVKQVAPTTIKMLPRQQTVRAPPTVIPQQSAEVCLRWNSYHSNMQNSFPSLLDSEEFVDVTLACEGKSLKCHKIILSSCSDYLAALLRENPCQHPIILMKDLKFWEVEALVKFMYRGEVNVAHDKLPQLLNAAEALQVKGLAGPSPSQPQKPPMLIPQTKIPTSNPPAPPSKPTETKDPKPPSNPPPAGQSTSKRTPKRPLESKESRPFTKIRLQRPKTPTSTPSTSPVVKLEPLDIPLSPTDIFPENNDDSSTPNYENMMTLHEDDDPGGEERPDSADGDMQFEFQASEDINETEEQMEFVPTDFLEQEQDIMEEADGDSSRNSIVEVRNASTKPGEEPGGSSKDSEGEKKSTKKDKT